MFYPHPNEGQKKITFMPYTRDTRRPGVHEAMLGGMPKKIEEYVIPADETCSVLGGELKVISKSLIRTGKTESKADGTADNQVYRLWNI